MSNGHPNTWGDIAHRLGIWGSVIAIGIYVFTMGQWVGAADEKLEGAEAVEATQKELVLDVNTLTLQQGYTTAAVEANTAAIVASKKEILEAIKAIKD